MEPLLLLALVLGLRGVLLVWWSVRSRERRGLGSGETIALDDLVLYSERLLLVGRPDRIERQGDDLIPEEWKPSKRVYPGHRLQLAWIPMPLLRANKIVYYASVFPGFSASEP